MIAWQAEDPAFDLANSGIVRLEPCIKVEQCIEHAKESDSGIKGIVAIIALLAKRAARFAISKALPDLILKRRIESNVPGFSAVKPLCGRCNSLRSVAFAAQWRAKQPRVVFGRVGLGGDAGSGADQLGHRPVKRPQAQRSGSPWRTEHMTPAKERAFAHLIAAQRPEKGTGIGTVLVAKFALAIELIAMVKAQRQVDGIAPRRAGTLRIKGPLDAYLRCLGADFVEAAPSVWNKLPGLLADGGIEMNKKLRKETDLCE